MNPFLHDTAGRPAGGPADAVRTHASSDGASVPGSGVGRARVPDRRPRVRRAVHRSARGLSRLLATAGIAALAWAGTAGAVDLNTATQDQLRGIRGIGPRTAQVILDERERGGRYLSFADLSDRVRGIGPRRAQALQSAGLTIDGGGTRLSGQGTDARAAAGPAGSGGSAGPAKPAAGKR
ncbi:ComEA family DNA-binding protein [Castellaniella sp. WN]